MSTDVNPGREITLRNFVHFHCMAGFADADDIWSMARFYGESADEAELRKMLDEELAAKAELERSFPPETDCDRLTKAFEALTARGIVAMENPSETASGGWEVFHETLAEWEEKGALAAVRGGCFYHGQDLEDAVRDGQLHVRFGHVSDEEGELAQALGHEIVEVLQSHGLSVSWGGQTELCPVVTLKWQRRLGPPASLEPPEELCTFEELPEEEPDEVELSEEAAAGATAVVVNGALTADTRDQFLTYAQALTGNLIIDLEKAGPVDEDGLFAIITLAKKRGVATVTSNDNLWHHCKLTGLAGALKLCRTREEAEQCLPG